MRRAKFFEESFVNNIGQTVNPGDQIVAVTSGYSHQTSTRRGTYLGVLKQDADVVAVRVKLQFTKRVPVDADGYEVYIFSVDRVRFDTRVVEKTRGLPLKRVYALKE